MKNKTVNALRKENRKALQFLHTAHGFDFEKPFFIKRLEGRFTYNTVTKAISEKLDGNYKAVLLLKPNKDGWQGKLHPINIKLGKFERPDKMRGQNYRFDMEEFFTVGDFEETRKNNTKHVYIIAQNNEYKKLPADKRINTSERYKIDASDYYHVIRTASDGRGNSWIDKIILKPNDGSHEALEYHPLNSFYYEEREKAGTDINNYIDKSGDLIRAKRHDLLTRAKALKAEREKNALLKADFTAEETRIFAKLEETKKQLADAVLKADTIEGARKVYDAALRFRYAISSKDDYKFRDFPSIAKKQTALNFVENEINSIIEALEGK